MTSIYYPDIVNGYFIVRRVEKNIDAIRRMNIAGPIKLSSMFKGKWLYDVLNDNPGVIIDIYNVSGLTVDLATFLSEDYQSENLSSAIDEGVINVNKLNVDVIDRVINNLKYSDIERLEFLIKKGIDPKRLKLERSSIHEDDLEKIERLMGIVAKKCSSRFRDIFSSDEDMRMIIVDLFFINIQYYYVGEYLEIMINHDPSLFTEKIHTLAMTGCEGYSIFDNYIFLIMMVGGDYIEHAIFSDLSRLLFGSFYDTLDIGHLISVLFNYLGYEDHQLRNIVMDYFNQIRCDLICHIPQQSRGG